MDEDYETLRNKNIAERNAFFAELFQDAKKQKQEIKELEVKHIDVVKDVVKDEDSEDLENEPPKKKQKRDPETRLSRRRYDLRERKTYSTRNRAKGSNENEDDEEENYSKRPRRSGRKLRVLFPWAKPAQRSVDLMKMGVCDVDEEEEEYEDNDSDDDYDDDDYDDDDYNDDDYDNDNYRRSKKTFLKVKKAPYDPNTIPSVDEITDEMLENVAERFSDKTYDKIDGTSCHQCRQKTLDTKTVCRSGECIGVRGQFCGRCLRTRYGESAVEALKNPTWSCPPCRGLCNCSICRTREGLPPTGILVYAAQEEGYSSVLDYLQSTERED
ncbi:cell division cycle-associated protein 7-like [Ceratina calcarata]|uniref:Cell division cycle-associated protein 7-like n=1 Tax=Ceratina calcarata TaxID=156304 RepID=A0AAJ7JCT8_9HYME|nr:cell division cycle-associated protein 7-like [Ceratina calcarata]